MKHYSENPNLADSWDDPSEDHSPMETKKASELALDLCHAIEAAGASELLTKCSVLASELRSRVVKMETDELARATVKFCEEVAAIRARG